MDWEIENGGLWSKARASKEERNDGWNTVGRNDGLREKLDWKWMHHVAAPNLLREIFI